MMIESKETHGAILVLAGLADPCGNIGTECRYDLVPVPWSKETLTSSVSQLLKAEQWVVAAENFNTTQAIGLRCWVCRHPESEPLQSLVASGWSESQGSKAARLIDSLSLNIPAIEFVWTSDDPSDEDAIEALQNALSQL